MIGFVPTHENRSQDAVKQQALARADGRCEVCERTTEALHIMHFVPKALGGDDSLANLKVVCASCNLSLADNDPEIRRRAMSSASEAYRLERAVAGTLQEMGYGVLSNVTGPDAGIDLIIGKQDPGSGHRTTILVECKSSSRPVTAADIELFARKCREFGGSRGLVVVNTAVTADVKGRAEQLGLTISNLEDLAQAVAALSDASNA